MNKEEYFKRIINRICKDYGYDVATAFEGLYLEKNKEIEELKEDRQITIFDYKGVENERICFIQRR